MVSSPRWFRAALAAMIVATFGPAMSRAAEEVLSSNAEAGSLEDTIREPVSQVERSVFKAPFPAASQMAEVRQPTYLVAQNPATGTSLIGGAPSGEAASTPTIPVFLTRTAPNEHPLAPAIRWAKDGLKQFSQIHDYSCTMVKRERIDGTLGQHEYMFVKVRHEPFSVYTYFLGPPALKGQEAIYIAGRNDGKLQGHATGIKKRLIGTVSLNPTSMLAMVGNRYPITEMGLKRLTERLIEVGEQDAQYGECDVQVIPEAKINDRMCTCIQVVHPVPRRNFTFHLARIYVDNEYNLPTRYEAYDWPRQQGGTPELIEEYTYLNLKMNNGFTDLDFDIHNPAYSFD